MNKLNYEEQLYKIFNNENDWLKFAEAKNFGLLTLNAAIVFGLTQITFSNDSVIKMVAFCVFVPFSILSFIPCLISLFPIVTKIESKNKKGEVRNSMKFINYLSNKIDKDKSFENIHFYGYLKDLKEEKFEKEFLKKTGSKDEFTTYERELVTQILYNSRITSLKYKFFKIGAFLFLIGILVSVFALPIFKLLM
ncbi:hypothetical protein EOJ36_02980 [Sandaracinomonas limnophila]|uniref:Pycsar effector protein domain-containing protein n=1 Tax=Sandaracinomonas limnophila TaxID=1862386 RepID=A0A437PXJ3_9BACT|nr:Pycsar system effector family protein [Sandaracinomonas limnophila]RVU26977.1 hypothetical protein EOJ36_02980 [Sandaracinomonas limnophila]